MLAVVSREMDSGIITQVARDECVPAAGSSNATISNGSVCADESSINNSSDVEGGSACQQSSQTLTTARRGSLLASILCCGCSKNDGTSCTKDGTQRLEGSSNGSNGCQQNLKPSLVPVTAGVPSSGEAFLIGEARSEDRQKKCVVIDLDETLVHSSFNPVPNADFVIPVEIDGVVHQVYVLKRPFVDQFLSRMGELFECVLFTASLAKYADPVTDLLDRTGCFRYRLFREACVYHKGNYVKDLSRIGREVCNTVIIDNSPASYIFHPDNAVPVGSWFDDPNDTELLELIPFFEGLTQVESCVEVLKQSYPEC